MGQRWHKGMVAAANAVAAAQGNKTVVEVGEHGYLDVGHRHLYAADTASTQAGITIAESVVEGNLRYLDVGMG